MNPFEVERLGWEEIRGLPVVADPEIGTGRFRIVCSREGDGEEIEETEAIGTPLEVGVGRRADRRAVRHHVSRSELEVQPEVVGQLLRLDVELEEARR